MAPKVRATVPDSVEVGNELLVKIFLEDKNFQLVDAYIGCSFVDNPTVDTVVNTLYKRKRLDGCTQGLLVVNDTIKIGFRPTTPGMKSFEEITILTRDLEKVFRTQKFTFDYRVTAGMLDP
jgi:hypothetical protein